MGFYNLELDELSTYTKIPVLELKNKSYVELESMIRNMKKEKILEQNNRNAQDKEYERLILKFFKPLNFLKNWFDEKEIVLACALTGMKIRDLCSEQFVKPGTDRKFWEKQGEYLRTSVESVIQYDKQGRPLLEIARKTMDVYRVANQYQGTHHGDVIQYLLYHRYPELAKYGFKFYEYHDYEDDYEIYPDNHIYISFTALMSGDLDWILERNRDYCKWYNNGRFTLEECEKAFQTEEAHEMFDLICRIGEQEKALDHSFITTDSETGKSSTTHGLKETKVSASGDIKLMEYEKPTYGKVLNKTKFKLAYAAACTVEHLVSEFLSMVTSSNVDIHIYHITDYLGKYGCHIENATTEDVLGNFNIVQSVFGLKSGNKYDLTIRIYCPELIHSDINGI